MNHQRRFGPIIYNREKNFSNELRAALIETFHVKSLRVISFQVILQSHSKEPGGKKNFKSASYGHLQNQGYKVK
jgi:hypothetical protein